MTTKNRGGYWGTAGARKKLHLPQYDSFMGMRGGIGRLLEMLIPSSFEEPHWMTESIFISMPANYCKSVSQSKAAGSSKNHMCDSHNC